MTLNISIVNKKIEAVEIEEQQYLIVYKTHPRAHVLRLRYSPCGQRILLTVPRHIKQSHIETFIKNSYNWLIRYKPQPFPPCTFMPDISFPFMGQELTIHHHLSKSKSVVKDKNLLHVMCPLTQVETVVILWLKRQAKLYFEEVCLHYASQIGVSYKAIKITDPKSRWGSCNTKGVLSFSWRLILAPQEVSQYVSIHEVCHLQEMNHSGRFWKLVENLCPAFHQHRKWLKQEGRGFKCLGYKINKKFCI